VDNWIYGLTLVTLTLAIHAASVAFLVWVLHTIRVRLETRRHLPHVLAIVIGAITAMGLLLATRAVLSARRFSTRSVTYRGFSPIRGDPVCLSGHRWET
jgi:hypothetical protein